MDSKLKARFARLGPIQDIDRVGSGSPATIFLSRRPENRDRIRAIDAVTLLVRHGATMLRAKRAVERALDDGGVATLAVPRVTPEMGEQLAGMGFSVARMIETDADPRAIREALGLSQSAFAERYRIPLRSLQNWEQGRKLDATTSAYLRAIAADPVGVAQAQLEALEG